MEQKGIIDKFIERYSSRKLLVFFIATMLCLFSDLTSSDWTILAGIYIGSQAVIDGITKMKGYDV